MLHLPPFINDLALILGSAAIVTLIFKKIKQPVVLGYIIAGFLIGPHINLFSTIIEIKSVRTWADIGVIFLLFGLGLEFSFKKLLKVGGVAAVTALTEISLTMLLGYGVGLLLGWSAINSLFLGGILAIASTTIIIRAFDELGVKNQKFAGIVTGVLIIEDLAAVILMVLLSTVAVSKSFVGEEMVMSVLKLVFFIVLWFILGIFFLPSFIKIIRSYLNDETLLIISLALCFAMVALATYAGFSSALGAFIMGSVLAETIKAEKIEMLVKPVKNLFGAVFFVSVGMLIVPQMILQHIVPIIAATLVLLLGKPLFVTLGALAAGTPLKISVQSGMSLSQIGEFSFIIAALGLSLKVTGDFLYPIAVAVSVFTTFTTPFMIRLTDPVYKLIEANLPKKWKRSLATYGVGAQNINETSDWKKLLRSYVINVVVYSVIIITVIVLTDRYLVPVFIHNGWNKIIIAVFSLIILSPFLWALAFRRIHGQAYANIWMKNTQRGPLIILQLSRIALAIFYIGFLFDRLFSPWTAFRGAVVACIILVILSRRIKSFYGRIEMRFMNNYHGRDAKTPDTNEILTPWDTHITIFELNAQSPYVGKTLSEIKLREEFGINIAMIERGDFVINVPGRYERIYPNDKLSVIGTDEQLEKFKFFIESSVKESPASKAKQKVSLHHFTIGENSSLLNKNLRESKIRERTNGLVVGIETEDAL
jgi:CPA2 family monovalent cation:H+ antiporter-2